MILFMFPYAGGSSLSFRGWLPHLSSQVRVVSLETPGRSRSYQTAPTEIGIPEMARAIITTIDAIVTKNEPFAFLGYSMGALLAFETARQLSIRKHPTPPPSYLFACACSAPDIKGDIKHTLDDKAFDLALKNYGGTSSEIIENDELMDIVRPWLRRDIRASELYEITTDFALTCPIDAIGGLDDLEVPIQDLKAWSRYTRQFGQIRTFTGGHFFVAGKEKELSDYVIVRLKSAGLC